jgi:hypothetical protein
MTDKIRYYCNTCKKTYRRELGTPDFPCKFCNGSVSAKDPKSLESKFETSPWKINERRPQGF